MQNNRDLENERLRSKLAALPDCPGVYMFKDSDGKVIYVGKASSLRNRVRSYFASSGERNPWHYKLRQRIHDIEYLTTRTEKEALILEGNLIKFYRPQFNIRFKDDKHYPFLKIPFQEPFPPLLIVRATKDDGALYFGPFTSSKALKETIDIIKRTFGMRVMTLVGNRRLSGCPWRDTSKLMPRACLEYHIMRCSGPCIGAVSEEDYGRLVKDVCAFLDGRHTQVIEELRRQMMEAAQKLEFERAAKIRDQIFAIERVIEKQSVVIGACEDVDAYGYAEKGGWACIQMLTVRSGRLIGSQSFIVRSQDAKSPADLLSAFLKQHYSSLVPIPQSIILPMPIEDAKVISEWLSDKRGSKVTVQVPLRGKLKELLNIAQQNAEQALASELEQSEREQRFLQEALESLRRYLALDRQPRRIECFDISNLHGHVAVGSMVVFQDGRPDKSSYRRFTIKMHEGFPDDYAMMREVLKRRFSRLLTGDEKFSTPPDIVLVDGGKGQANCAIQVLNELGLSSIKVAGLAKEHELIYLPSEPAPIALPYNDPALLLLQRIRDEAHSFAIRHHRTRRRKFALRSVLDGVHGIGSVRKQRLLMRFGSLEELKRASVDELASVPGMTRDVAKRLWEFLHTEQASHSANLEQTEREHRS
ncbi:MAG: excinuclease ABC subunit UvrC [Armatimonadota bacterium]|nr:excinuclease ABC subunit UvrC [Armatimonadota bacterium]MCX7777685.1 excinuclease ABC subunit UvrC [Armatimonadota bacterium]MDW8025444.1 excinuclease ABC subunit UvrC [Armatimonadota bacterium]